MHNFKIYKFKWVSTFRHKGYLMIKDLPWKDNKHTHPDLKDLEIAVNLAEAMKTSLHLIRACQISNSMASQIVKMILIIVGSLTKYDQ